MFNRRKNIKKAEALLGDISGRLRAFIFDSQIQEADALSVAIGCKPISPEVAEKEEQESDKRVQKIAYLLPLLYAHAHTISDGAMNYQRAALEKEFDIADQLDPEIWEYSKSLLEQLSLSTLIGSITQLVDMGLLQVPKDYR
jgi:hypothetical protein